MFYPLEVDDLGSMVLNQAGISLGYCDSLLDSIDGGKKQEELNQTYGF